ncbi:hypothetical protein FACS1894122_12110 [Alphaproteobacteria bacterium]|nr:hypothetical protein FACS1894122_12110 [Alphaproteobacteria bacterium]
MVRIIYDDGIIYEGEYSSIWPNGQGKKTYPDGSIVEGEFVEGWQNGKGKRTCPDGVYRGTFRNGKQQGKIKMECNDGKIVYGDFVNCKMPIATIDSGVGSERGRRNVYVFRKTPGR